MALNKILQILITAPRVIMTWALPTFLTSSPNSASFLLFQPLWSPCCFSNKACSLPPQDLGPAQTFVRPGRLWSGLHSRIASADHLTEGAPSASSSIYFISFRALDTLWKFCHLSVYLSIILNIDHLLPSISL